VSLRLILILLFTTGFFVGIVLSLYFLGHLPEPDSALHFPSPW
jgi:hypothetical protein